MSSAVAVVRRFGDADDDALAVARALEEPEAFGVLYERYGVRVYRYLRSKTLSNEEAADLTQTVFLKAFASLGSYRGDRTPFVAWLFRIARNASIDAHRRQKRAAAVDAVDWLQPANDPPDPAEAAMRRERLEKLRRLLLELDAQKRDLLVLRFGGGLSSSQIAAVVGKSESSVKKQLWRIISALKEHYRDELS